MGDWEAEDLTQHITALPATQQPRERIMSADKGGGDRLFWSSGVEKHFRVYSIVRESKVAHCV